MNIESFITDIGGRKSVMAETGLTKGRISQWVCENSIPKPWIKYFQSQYPKEAKRHGIEVKAAEAA